MRTTGQGGSGPAGHPPVVVVAIDHREADSAGRFVADVAQRSRTGVIFLEVGAPEVGFFNQGPGTVGIGVGFQVTDLNADVFFRRAIGLFVSFPPAGDGLIGTIVQPFTRTGSVSPVVVGRNPV